MRKYTTADIENAVRALEAANVPPAACERCGAKFYMLNPQVQTIDDGVLLIDTFGPMLCGACSTKEKGDA